MTKKSKKLPWAKFYWDKWLSDVGLRSCSVGARGVWMDMLAIAAQNDPVGYVGINGLPCTVQDIAGISRVTIEYAQEVIAELELKGVCSRSRTGALFSRRMVRDDENRRNSEKNGRKGGNPKLLAQKENSEGVNPPVKAKSLEDRGKRIDKTLPSEELAVESPGTDMTLFGEEPAPKVEKVKPHRLPDGFEPDPRVWENPNFNNLTPEEITNEIGNFKDYWAASASPTSKKMNWQAALRVWLARANKDKEQRRGPKNRTGVPGGGAIADALAVGDQIFAGSSADGRGRRGS